MRQLLLNVLLRDDASFENYYAGSNQAVLEYLRKPFENLIYLYSKPHAGLTHVLQALCKASFSCTYIPLEQISEFSPELLMGLDNLDLIIMDDLEKLAGQSEWEESLFNLYNQVVQHKKTLILGSHVLPQQQNIQLRDLKSRLQGMLLLTLESLTDDEKIRALQLRAHYRGLQLPVEVAQYLLNHLPRDTAKLFEILNDLDKQSLEENRRLTIPFVKKVLYTERFL